VLFRSLFDIYACGKIAFVGGGFDKTQIHNVLEPAAFGLPVIHGPNYDNYREATGLLEAEGSRVVSTAQELANLWQLWISDEDLRQIKGQNAARYVRQGGGATEKIAAYLAVK
jgi:3-deoxy-D-manno-octulosonic-acid transferase